MAGRDDGSYQTGKGLKGRRVHSSTLLGSGQGIQMIMVLCNHHFDLFALAICLLL